MTDGNETSADRPLAIIRLEGFLLAGTALFYGLVALASLGGGPEEDISEIDVEPSFYASLHKGDRICVYVGRGRLGARWYEAGRC